MSVEASIRRQQIEKQPSVLDRLVEKRNLMKAGLPHDHIRPGLIIDGGGMKEAFGAGVLTRLVDMGFQNSFTDVMGNSSGAIAGAIFSSERTHTGRELFMDDLRTRKFINNWNLVNPFKPSRVMDFDYLNAVLHGDHGIDEDRVRSQPYNTFVGVTKLDGTGELISLKEPGLDMVHTTLASCANPFGFTGLIRVKRPHISDEPEVYADGEMAVGLPIRFAAQERGCTDILVVSNVKVDDPTQKRTKPSKLERAFITKMMRRYPTPIVDATLSRRERFFGPLTEDHGANVQVIAPDKDVIGLTSINGKKIMEAFDMGYSKPIETVLYQRV